MTTSLQHILFGVALREVIGSTNQEIVDLQIDSRLVQPGTAFVAIKGVQVDGHQFISTAIEKGATVIVCETLPASIKYLKSIFSKLGAIIGSVLVKFIAVA